MCRRGSSGSIGIVRLRGTRRWSKRGDRPAHCEHRVHARTASDATATQIQRRIIAFGMYGSERWPDPTGRRNGGEEAEPVDTVRRVGAVVIGTRFEQKNGPSGLLGEPSR